MTEVKLFGRDHPTYLEKGSASGVSIYLKSKLNTPGMMQSNEQYQPILFRLNTAHQLRSN